MSLQKAVLSSSVFLTTKRQFLWGQRFLTLQPKINNKNEEKYILRGPKPHQPIPDISLSKFVYDYLKKNISKETALIDARSGEVITYSHLFQSVFCLAESMKRHDFGAKTVIMLCSENTTCFFLPVLAAIFVGAIVTTMRHTYTPPEMIEAMNISKPKMLFGSREACKKLIPILNQVPFLERLIMIDCDDEMEGVEPINKFINTCSIRRNVLNIKPTDADPANQIAFILKTSGVTEKARGVMITQRNALIALLNCFDPRYQQNADNEVFYTTCPFCSPYAFITNIYYLLSKKTIFVLQNFDIKVFCAAVEKYKITNAWLTSHAILEIARHPLPKCDLSSIKEIKLSNIGFFGNDIKAAIKAKFKGAIFVQRYSLVEATANVLMVPHAGPKFDSCGKPVPYMYYKVVDTKTRQPLGPNKPGELCVKGPLVAKGYYMNEEDTKKVFMSDGWLMTTDLLYYDEGESFYFIDRKQDVIFYKTLTVCSSSVQKILVNHPDILKVAVIGIAAGADGQVPAAVIVKKPGSKITEEDVIQFMKDKGDDSQQLRGGVTFVDDFPKTRNGKVIRYKLPEIIEKQKNKKI